MELELRNVIYLFFRLSPIILVGYFILQSFFNSDVKGLFYLAGLIITLIITILASRNEIFKRDNIDMPYFCKGMTFGHELLSYIPLSQTILIYTLSYIISVIVEYDTMNINVPTLTLISILIISDLMWNIKNNCSGYLNIFTSWLIAFTIGFIWTNYLLSTGHDIVFFHGVSDANVCKMNTDKFRCRLK